MPGVDSNMHGAPSKTTGVRGADLPVERTGFQRLHQTGARTRRRLQQRRETAEETPLSAIVIDKLLTQAGLPTAW